MPDHVKLTPEQALQLIEYISMNAECDAAFKHKRVAKFAGSIYKVAHSTLQDCKHLDWERETSDRYDVIAATGELQPRTPAPDAPTA